MTKNKSSIVENLSALVDALTHIIIIIQRMSSEEEDAPSPLPSKKGYIFKTFSALKTTLLTDLLHLTNNEYKILDLIIKYRALTARNIASFLHVKKRQIYNYLERLHEQGLVTYTEIPLGEGPPTRFYHFSAVTQDELVAIVVAERSAKQRHKLQVTAAVNKKLLHFKCANSECNAAFQEYEMPQECPKCGHHKLVIYVI